MSDNVTIGIDGNVDGLLDALKTAKVAIDDTFNFDSLASDQKQKPVTDLFKNMERSSDVAIRNMIRGTQTWQQSFLQVASNMEIRFAQLVAHKLFNWAESELGMTAATEAGNALRLASDEESGAASLAAKAQHAVAAIMNDAQQVFGGIFAFLAPEMGPAAAAPASAGSATVAGLASSITYAETGAWHIPSNTMAYLHAGEMVVPQPFADSLRAAGGMGGGGDSYTITIHAIDTQSGAQFLKNNAASIASALSSQVRSFNRHAPAWKG